MLMQLYRFYTSLLLLSPLLLLMVFFQGEDKKDATADQKDVNAGRVRLLQVLRNLQKNWLIEVEPPLGPSTHAVTAAGYWSGWHCR